MLLSTGFSSLGTNVQKTRGTYPLVITFFMDNPYMGVRTKKCRGAKIFFVNGDVLPEPLRLQGREEEKAGVSLSIKNTQKRPFVIGDEKRLVFLPGDKKCQKTKLT